MLQLMMLISFLALTGLSSPQSGVLAVNEEHDEEFCPPCENFFRKLERNEENGLLSQVVKVQERGEPKSGTAMMFDWATGALVRTCSHLQTLFGKETDAPI